MKIEMNGKALAGVVVAACCTVYLTSANAGDLNPPFGSVSPTMTTLGEIGNAVRGDAVQYETTQAGPMAITHMTAETQGNIQGTDIVGPLEDVIEIYGFSHEVDSPRDAASGLPTGQRQHKPLVVIKEIDRSSPLLMNVLINNENVPAFGLVMLAEDPMKPGALAGYWTVELVNASISNIRHDTIGVGMDGTPLVREFVSFVYQKIIWTWEDGGITAEDDWETPVAR